jgi:hypothetical protein
MKTVAETKNPRFGVLLRTATAKLVLDMAAALSVASVAVGSVTELERYDYA